MNIALVVGLIVLGIFYDPGDFFLPGVSVALIGGLACFAGA